MFILYSINKCCKSLHYFITFSKINLTVITLLFRNSSAPAHIDAYPRHPFQQKHEPISLLSPISTSFPQKANP